ncbi:MAG: DegT/DnrJ/EryC1/StrS family aminotransferase [Prolixibacteraceae bacterium]|jgi:dTDP-4-amino-4,6-dideoxygalactose transaminase|nr:DegT/DnrJ/EryC1/StrS family aminotransferase [Prolixibacteraceae bacterium]
MQSSLALFGGSKIRKCGYPPHKTTGEEEKRAVIEVLEKGVLSEFEGTNNEYFLGGEQVRLLEDEWAHKFGVRYAISFNSATSALFAAVGACGVGPGDEVIVTPYTMSATATAIIVYNGIPVFADVEMKNYNLDPVSVESRITDRTKIIFVVHIFGHPADMDSIMMLAEKHNIMVIEDAAQAPGAFYKGRLAGTIGDIGVYSLNCNKVIQCGEGGIAVTNSDDLAGRLRLIRNHAEAVIAAGKHVDSLVNMIGWNYRMNEIEAAISREQLKKMDMLNEKRLSLVHYLNEKLCSFEGLSIPNVEKDCTHVYYRYALKLDTKKIGIKAPLFVKALNAEGMDFYVSYMKPLYLQPIYQEQIGFGKQGCPFKCPLYKGVVDYKRGICPNAEKLEDIVISTEMVRPPQTFEDMDEIADAIKKVIKNRDELIKYENEKQGCNNE